MAQSIANKLAERFKKDLFKQNDLLLASKINLSKHSQKTPTCMTQKRSHLFLALVSSWPLQFRYLRL
ncbi:hypothetical protein BET10_17610 [Pseudoalteromonas amylolytica]|uniref:Uncharacterized protein n=1 Tax=Pseudoalteromonas amylolytica TaxID=1859457 RepID=A0A1S1MRW7_9GAMM|nr:hypothetical protein BFC16_16965 [Pseudoalteromonas sp. JW3]OHU89432.1 hypothetical protein BET10_17610 [Pseudoalteromonas amylolytica]